MGVRREAKFTLVASFVILLVHFIASSKYPTRSLCANYVGKVSDNCQHEPLSPEEVVSLMRTNPSPFVVIPNYWSLEKAEAAKFGVKAALECGVEYDGDFRRMGVEELDSFDLAQELARDSYLHAIAKLYVKTSTLNTKVMAGRTLPGGKSGGGWHVDEHAIGIKALVYLEDVTETSGPFQFLMDYSKDKLRHDTNDARRRKTRYTDYEVDTHIADGAVVHSVTGSAGTLVLFDVSNVHRGAPCISSERYSLTVYYGTNLPTTECTGLGYSKADP